ncbi:hypothetical protein [Paraburkholderia sp. 32]|uniref:hypothetical protein n=1 Tax=Paraburkholderia sp. 32 TaxID=2991057 RepID=UPI003D1F08B4
MSPELDAKLCADYPLIFDITAAVDPDAPALLSSFAAWGFECGDGWYDLIDALCWNLQQATKNGGPQVVASQVKEKFGGLRFHVSAPSEEQIRMIELAETMSARLCEIRGNRGKLIQTNWVRTRCSEHEGGD